MSSTVITIPDGEGVTVLKPKRKFQCSLFPILSFLREEKSKHDLRRLIHSAKVGVALVLASLLYFLGPVYREVGEDNAMWAIMTVIVIFEFYAGATLSKGINRGIGTILGGGLGCLAASLGQGVGGVGNSIIVGICVFLFGGAATYTRLIPSIKKKYDYGAMIFILTFNLVAVSGLRVDQVMEIARERLLMIVLGFGICICTSLFFYPIWAGDELHDSLVSKFEGLASSVEGSLEVYFTFASQKENQPLKSIACFNKCKSVMDSKAKEEALANFAKWEPWHGKFGLSYPWEKYLKTGELLRELAMIILSLENCLQSPIQPSQTLRDSIKEPCEAVGSSLAWILRELGDSIMRMRRCQAEVVIAPKLKSVRLELSQIVPTPKTGEPENIDVLAIASFMFSLMKMVEKLEELSKEVEGIGEPAGFHRS